MPPRMIFAVLALTLATPAVAQAALPTAAQRSTGTSTAYKKGVGSAVEYGFAFSGQIRVGQGVFKGTASGSYRDDYYTGVSPLVLTGPGFSATCEDGTGLYDTQPTAGTMSCVGHVGAAPESGFTLVVAYPETHNPFDPTTGASYYTYAGRYAG